MRERKNYPNRLSGVFDTHAHLYDSRYEEEGITSDELLASASSVGINRILIPADNIESSRKALEFAHQNDGKHGIRIYASVGVHPHEAKEWSAAALEKIAEWADTDSRSDSDFQGITRTGRVRAIGEIGLDYHYDFSPREDQRRAFYEQMCLACELDIPIILHEREATGDLMQILRRLKEEKKLLENPGVCHCCSCSPEIARELVKLGFYIGFDGPVTFGNNKNAPALLATVPLERIVVETDSPYLTPQPNRGMINMPSMVPFVIEKIADLLCRETDEMAAITSDNGRILFRIGENE